VSESVVHYHGERNHQGVGNRLLVPGEQSVERRERLGGLLNFYYRRVA
jgi:hypothetical protein